MATYAFSGRPAAIRIYEDRVGKYEAALASLRANTTLAPAYRDAQILNFEARLNRTQAGLQALSQNHGQPVRVIDNTPVYRSNVTPGGAPRDPVQLIEQRGVLVTDSGTYMGDRRADTDGPDLPGGSGGGGSSGGGLNPLVLLAGAGVLVLLLARRS